MLCKSFTHSLKIGRDWLCSCYSYSTLIFETFSNSHLVRKNTFRYKSYSMRMLQLLLPTSAASRMEMRAQYPELRSTWALLTLLMRAMTQNTFSIHIHISNVPNYLSMFRWLKLARRELWYNKRIQIFFLKWGAGSGRFDDLTTNIRIAQFNYYWIFPT